MFRPGGTGQGPPPGVYDVEAEKRQANIDLLTKLATFAGICGFIKALPTILRVLEVDV